MLPIVLHHGLFGFSEIGVGPVKIGYFRGIDRASDLTTEHCKRFYRVIKNVRGVRYFSVSAARPWHRVPPLRSTRIA